VLHSGIEILQVHLLLHALTPLLVLLLVLLVLVLLVLVLLALVLLLVLVPLVLVLVLLLVYVAIAMHALQQWKDVLDHQIFVCLTCLPSHDEEEGSFDVSWRRHRTNLRGKLVGSGQIHQDYVHRFLEEQDRGKGKHSYSNFQSSFCSHK